MALVESNEEYFPPPLPKPSSLLPSLLLRCYSFFFLIVVCIVLLGTRSDIRHWSVSCLMHYEKKGRGEWRQNIGKITCARS